MTYFSSKYWLTTDYKKRFNNEYDIEYIFLSSFKDKPNCISFHFVEKKLICDFLISDLTVIGEGFISSIQLSTKDRMITLQFKYNVHGPNQCKEYCVCSYDNFEYLYIKLNKKGWIKLLKHLKYLWKHQK